MPSFMSAAVSLLLVATSSAQPIWVAKPNFAPRYAHAMVYDDVRDRLVIHGGIGQLAARSTIFRDTWEWDRGRWLQRSPRSTPVAGAAVYDAARQRTVLVNSIATYTWDGAAWVTVGAGPSPAVTDHALAYDRGRSRVVLFGGSAFTPLPTLVDDTWEWNGASWTLRTPAVVPPARENHAMAYDRARGRVVLFGGEGANRTVLSDTWEWDGATWQQRFPATVPAARFEHAMAYDPVRGRVVMVGGTKTGGTFSALDETWEWDGTDWVAAAPAPHQLMHNALVWHEGLQRIVLLGGQEGSLRPIAEGWQYDGTRWTSLNRQGPPARYNHDLVYDARRERVVLFGGQRGVVTPLNDTWEWDGARWRLRRPSTSPPPRFNHAFAFDRGRSRAVVFGGWPHNDETWEYDGVDWRQRTPSARPSPRAGAAMVYDQARGHVLLFGGNRGATVGSSASANGDTWAWDGTQWSMLANTGPSPRTWHQVAYDAARQRVVLFGGRDEAGNSLADTWEWDGSSWQARSPGTSPPPGSRMEMAYDAGRGTVVLFSYWNGLDFWEWDGNDWNRIATGAAVPGPRAGHAMAYDEARQRMVLNGGSNSVQFADTWVFGDTSVAAVATFGAGCEPLGPAPALAAVGLPFLGNIDYGMDVIGAGAARAGVVAVGLGPASLPLGAGCTLGVDPSLWLVGLPIVTNGGGFASVRTPIPMQLSLIGLDVYSQAAVLSAGGTALGAMSSGLRWTIGE